VSIFIDFAGKEMDLEHLAVYIKYVIRPRRVIHFSTDHGALVRQCEKLGLDALAIDCNGTDEARTSNVIYRNWVDLKLDLADLKPEPQENLDDIAPLLILATGIPQHSLYFSAPNIVDNLTLTNAKIWLIEPNLDRWIYDISHCSYIVDVDATVHAVTNTNCKSVIFKRAY
jgi:hypothetical protein